MSKPGKIAVDDDAIDASLQRGREYDRHATKIVRANYDREHDQIVAVLSTGATVSVPRRNLPYFDIYQVDDFGPVKIEAPGYALWFEKPDIGVRIEGLIRAAGGEDLIRSVAAQALGSVRSEKKAEAARKNGMEGGRPPQSRAVVTPVRRTAAGEEVRTTQLQPGEVAPRSGEYTILGPRARKADQTLVRGKSLPPTPAKGTQYEMQRPAQNDKGGKKK